MVSVGSSAEREIQDYHLTRYACYLIAQNGDSRKQEIAFAMSYFAFSTRRLELIEERFEEIERVQARESLTDTEKVFSWLLYERGIDGAGFARIRSSGDRAFFWGHASRNVWSIVWVCERARGHLPTIFLQSLWRRKTSRQHWPIITSQKNDSIQSLISLLIIRKITKISENSSSMKESSLSSSHLRKMWRRWSVDSEAKKRRFSKTWENKNPTSNLRRIPFDVKSTFNCGRTKAQSIFLLKGYI